MTLFDIILLCIIGGFGLFGFWFGLISAAGSLLGTALGAFLAFRFYIPFADNLMKFTGWTGNFPKVVAFIIVFLIINRLIGFIFYVIGKIFSPLTNLPFIHSLDSILGAILGLFEGVFVMGIIAIFIKTIPVGDFFMNQIRSSVVIPWCTAVASILWPLIPEFFKTIKS